MRGEALYHVGDHVIFRVQKRSTHPGPRAKDVWPERSGEGYLYQVDKFWTVREMRGNQVVIIITRRGKVRVVDTLNPALRKARWWEKRMYRNRFPSNTEQSLTENANLDLAAAKTKDR